MRLYKVLITFAYTIFIFIIFNRLAFAKEETFKPTYTTKHIVEYYLKEDLNGNTVTQVNHNITINFTNNQKGLKEVIFKEPVDDISNLKLVNKNKDYSIYNEKNKVVITFKNPIVGNNKKINLNYFYHTYNIFKKIGTTYLLDIPKVKEEPNIKDFILKIQLNPTTKFYTNSKLGNIKKNNNKEYIEIDYNTLKKSGNFIILGNQMYYKVNIKYLIDKNKNSFVTLPTIQDRQESYILKISNNPDYVKKDFDGNTIFFYNNVKETKIVEVDYLIRVYGNKTPIKNKLKIKKYTKKEKYWDYTKGLPQYYLSNFNKGTKLEKIQNIYKYIINYLDYDYKKTNYDFINRIGAENLNDENKKNAVCLEYSDLMISILRGMSIPARELSGVALVDSNENSTQMHSWLEYELNGYWVQADPTWGDTAKQDYLNNFDLYHIIFLIRGENSESPILPGSYANNKSIEAIDINILKNNPIKKKAKILKANIAGINIYKNTTPNYIGGIKPYKISLKLKKDNSKIYEIVEIKTSITNIFNKNIVYITLGVFLGTLTFILLHFNLSKKKKNKAKDKTRTIK